MAFMAISYVNTLIHNNIFNDITLFYCRNSSVVTKPLCMATSVDKIFQFDGLLISTDLLTASIIKKCKSKKILYLWDLEWLRGKGNYFANVEILTDLNLELICRSKSHFDAIKNYCGKDANIIPNFNLKTIIEKYANE